MVLVEDGGLVASRQVGRGRSGNARDIGFGLEHKDLDRVESALSQSRDLYQIIEYRR